MDADDVRELKNNCQGQYVLIIIIGLFCGITYFWVLMPVLFLLLGFIQLRSAIYYMRRSKARGESTAFFTRYFKNVGIWVAIQAATAIAGNVVISAVVISVTSMALAIWFYVELSELRDNAQYESNTHTR
ncbi:MAG: hypothetical protein MUC87_00320 [Bacteroidia bacterium]|jgi:hypothetical protein|nr:hypothetical protein [Bacteroidia bacterium]